MTRQFYGSVLKLLWACIFSVRPKIPATGWILHHDNASAHSLFSVQQFWRKKAFQRCYTHPIAPISPLVTFFCPKWRRTSREFIMAANRSSRKPSQRCWTSLFRRITKGASNRCSNVGILQNYRETVVMVGNKISSRNPMCLFFIDKFPEPNFVSGMIFFQFCRQTEVRQYS